MSYLEAHEKELYELRFSPMCKPAAEVANLTQLESHSTRGRVMMMWRIAAGHLEWGAREAELLYETTLDSISEAFDVFHYPVSQYMLDARADVWEAGLAPTVVQEAVERAKTTSSSFPAPEAVDGALVLAGEIGQIAQYERFTAILANALQAVKVTASIWYANSGALAYALGARQVALTQAQQIVEKISDLGVKEIIVDGPETAWALAKVYRELGVNLPQDTKIIPLSTLLLEKENASGKLSEVVMVHDSRPAYLIAEGKPTHLTILPGYLEDENQFGEDEVYQAPRRLLKSMGAEIIFGTWTRGLAKSCGADDGLWLTHPHLAQGLARQRLEYAKSLGANQIITDSPLCVHWMAENASGSDPSVRWLPEVLT